MRLESKYDIGDQVHIDGDGSINGVVVSLEWRGTDCVRYEVSWMANGDAKFYIFDEWRLKRITR